MTSKVNCHSHQPLFVRAFKWEHLSTAITVLSTQQNYMMANDGSRPWEFIPSWGSLPIEQYLIVGYMLVLLRTHYNPNDDDKMNEWVYKNDLFDDNAWWACLNDPNLFNFGPNWQQVYEIMSEVAGPVDHRRRSEGPCKPQFFRASPQNDQDGLHERRDNRFETTVELANHPQNDTIMVYIVIADQEAFQTGRLRLLCLNAKRNIVRELHVDRKPAEVMQLIRHSNPIFRP
jgi:hypothetical protein